MMIFWLAVFVCAGPVLFTYYLVGLTRDEQTALRRLQGRDLYARWALEHISAVVHAPLLSNRGSCRDFTRSVLHDLASDWSELGLAGARRWLGWLAFCGLYGLTWVKSTAWAGPGDLRPVIGLHLLLLR